MTKRRMSVQLKKNGELINRNPGGIETESPPPPSLHHVPKYTHKTTGFFFD